MPADTRPRRHLAAVLTGWILGALTAMPALALAPWLVFGLASGWTGDDFSTGEPGPRDWSLVAGSAGGLLLCIAVPVLVGWGACRLLDLGLRHRRPGAGA